MFTIGYLGSMGLSAAAMVSQITYPDRQVVCITGDGGFTMVYRRFHDA